MVITVEYHRGVLYSLIRGKLTVVTAIGGNTRTISGRSNEQYSRGLLPTESSKLILSSSYLYGRLDERCP